MAVFGAAGETLLELTALGLHLRHPRALTDLTVDGWHHMRVLRFPSTGMTKGDAKGRQGRGIGSHTDYGLLVIAAQDDVGGLFVRPPRADECLRNWEKSAAGANENDEKWLYVPPVPDVFTVFPGDLPANSKFSHFVRLTTIVGAGDMMQYLTKDYLQSTPHKVGLNTRERFAFAYFHEPNFSAVMSTLPEYATSTARGQDEGIHYGTHFTNMAMRCYPERITAKRMREENRMELLESPRIRRVMGAKRTWGGGQEAQEFAPELRALA